MIYRLIHLDEFETNTRVGTRSQENIVQEVPKF